MVRNVSVWRFDMKDRNFIECKELCFEYSDNEKNTGFVVLDNVNLSVKKGEMLAILGHNGSGKSTLAKLLNGLMLPKSGTVTVDGLSTENEDDVWAIRSKVGMVFQNPDNQLVASIVEDEIAFGPENLGLPPEEIEKNIDFALKAVDMEKFRYSTPSALSGGQKQRIAIAGVLAMHPQCIIFDESTAMLDSIGRAEVMKCAEWLNREEGITIIYITHDMEEALMADRIVVMCGGKVAMEGTPGEVFAQAERIRELGLILPPATELAYRLSKKVDVETDILSVD
jgi:energy-coupling factor transport system ATP-binding protein